ncbi:hypothetical protein DFS34DRAFT_558 [Phlyctochytrium arcticum]|nr:hypothetical protein DFS34DRAFT_558 [Phlyctochytrium arcticum]
MPGSVRALDAALTATRPAVMSASESKRQQKRRQRFSLDDHSQDHLSQTTTLDDGSEDSDDDNDNEKKEGVHYQATGNPFMGDPLFHPPPPPPPRKDRHHRQRQTSSPCISVQQVHAASSEKWLSPGLSSGCQQRSRSVSPSPFHKSLPSPPLTKSPSSLKSSFSSNSLRSLASASSSSSTAAAAAAKSQQHLTVPTTSSRKKSTSDSHSLKSITSVFSSTSETTTTILKFPPHPELPKCLTTLAPPPPPASSPQKRLSRLLTKTVTKTVRRSLLPPSPTVQQPTVYHQYLPPPAPVLRAESSESVNSVMTVQWVAVDYKGATSGTQQSTMSGLTVMNGHSDNEDSDRSSDVQDTEEPRFIDEALQQTLDSYFASSTPDLTFCDPPPDVFVVGPSTPMYPVTQSVEGRGPAADVPLGTPSPPADSVTKDSACTLDEFPFPCKSEEEESQSEESMPDSPSSSSTSPATTVISFPLPSVPKRPNTTSCTPIPLPRSSSLHYSRTLPTRLKAPSRPKPVPLPRQSSLKKSEILPRVPDQTPAPSAPLRPYGGQGGSKPLLRINTRTELISSGTMSLGRRVGSPEPLDTPPPLPPSKDSATSPRSLKPHSWFKRRTSFPPIFKRRSTTLPPPPTPPAKDMPLPIQQQQSSYFSVKAVHGYDPIAHAATLTHRRNSFISDRILTSSCT